MPVGPVIHDRWSWSWVVVLKSSTTQNANIYDGNNQIARILRTNTDLWKRNMQLTRLKYSVGLITRINLGIFSPQALGHPLGFINYVTLGKVGAGHRVTQRYKGEGFMSQLRRFVMHAVLGSVKATFAKMAGWNRRAAWALKWGGRGTRLPTLQKYKNSTCDMISHYT